MPNHRHSNVRIGKKDRELIRWFARHGAKMGRYVGYLLYVDNGVMSVAASDGQRLAEWKAPPPFPYQFGQKSELRTREPRTDFERAVLKALQEDTR